MNNSQVWDRQREFQRKVDAAVWKDQSHDHVVKTKEYLLCLITESIELLNEFDWKLHKKSNGCSPDENKVYFELVDIFKYWLNICLEWGMTEEDFFQAFEKKSAIVEDRFRREHEGWHSICC